MKYFLMFGHNKDEIETRFVFIMHWDKMYHNYGHANNVVLGIESQLKHVHHIWDNKLGFQNYPISYAATDILTIHKFKHKQHTTVIDTFNNIMRWLFNAKGSAESNLSGRIMLVVDRGYMLLSILRRGWGPERASWAQFSIGCVLLQLSLIKMTREEGRMQITSVRRMCPQKVSGQSASK